MRPGLLSPERDLDLDALPVADATLVDDLGLERLYVAMSRGDWFLDELVRRVLPGLRVRPRRLRLCMRQRSRRA